MLFFGFSLVLLAVACAASVLFKTYRAVPVRELRRSARQGDELAKTLYRAAAYKDSLNILLMAIICVSVAASSVLLLSVVPGVLVFGLEAVVLAYVFAWVPGGDLSRSGLRLAIWCTPTVVWILSKLHRPLQQGSDAALARWPRSNHTALYEKEDLLNLLTRQSAQADNRIDEHHLEGITRLLQFSDQHISDILVPAKTVKTVSQNDSIGPILLDELAKSGHSTFPVYESDNHKDRIVGVLFLKDAVAARQGGLIKDVMSTGVHYVHEEYSLARMLKAFLRTKSHMFLVVNRFNEYVGVATIEALLAQVLQVEADDFDLFDDRAAVVADHARHHETTTQAPAQPESAPPSAETDQA